MERCIPVREVMSTTIVSAHTGTSLKDLLRMLRKHRVRHIPILDERGRIRGLISNRDMLVAHVASKSVEGRQVAGHIMSRELVTVGPSVCVNAAGRVLLESRISCLPVVEENRLLLGVICESDFVRMALAAHRCQDD